MSDTITTKGTPPPTLTRHEQAFFELDALWRFRAVPPTQRKDPTTGQYESVDNGCILCDVIDKTTGKMYATGKGADQEGAMDDAIIKARAATKPLTKAQEADQKRFSEEKASLNTTLSDQAAEIERLKAELAAAKGTPPPAPAPKQRRKPKKEPGAFGKVEEAAGSTFKP